MSVLKTLQGLAESGNGGTVSIVSERKNIVFSELNIKGMKDLRVHSIDTNGILDLLLDTNNLPYAYKYFEKRVKELEDNFLYVEEMNTAYKVVDDTLFCTLGFIPTKEELETMPDGDIWSQVESFYPKAVKAVNKHFYTNFKANVLEGQG
jgi:hypothetical protein